MSIELAAQQEETGGFYLENAFVLSEGGKSYVFVRGEDGLLEKREILAGKRVDGYYCQVLGGLTQEDYIAFPYSKEAQDGAKTTEAGLDILYGY